MSQSACETLESLCLNAVVRNFDLFCAAFALKENDMQLYSEFIQKRCCSQILQKLFQRNLVKNQHLKIIINKYTKEIDFQNLLTCDLEAIICRLKEIGSVIQKVSMIRIKLFPDYDSIWNYLTNVEILELQHTNCSDQSLILISDHCPYLKSLNLYGCLKVSDKGLTYLSMKNPPLESLNVEETSVTYKAVACVLKNIPSIRELGFDNVPRAIFEATGLNDSVEQIVKERVFNLSNIVILNNPLRPESHLTSILEVCQSLCPFVKDLTVSEIMTDNQLLLCSSFEALESVNLQCSLIISHELCINNFLIIRGEKIRTLTLISFSLSLEVLVRNCPNLEHLTLEYPSFENIPVDKPELKLLHLKRLNFHNASVNSEENIKSISCIISSSPNIQELNFLHCELSDDIANYILTYPRKLKILGFSSTSVEASFLEEVLKVHNNLLQLRIDNSGITPDEYDDLMDIVDNMERKVHIIWADYTEAIRELYDTEINDLFRVKRQIMKL